MITPLEGMVLIKDQTEEKIGNFVIVDEIKDRDATIGTIVEVGTDKEVYLIDKVIKKPCPAKKGDKVIYQKYHGHSVNYKGEAYKLVDFADIIALIK